LNSTQLDATASAPGSITYNPPAGTILSAGSQQTLTATLTPTDTTNYTTATLSVFINVTPITPTIIWSDPANITYGTALGDTQLDTTTSDTTISPTGGHHHLGRGGGGHHGGGGGGHHGGGGGWNELQGTFVYTPPFRNYTGSRYTCIEYYLYTK